MNKVLTTIGLMIMVSCGNSKDQKIVEGIPTDVKNSGKVKVLNFATFHMGATTDANSVEFDEEDQKNQDDA